MRWQCTPTPAMIAALMVPCVAPAQTSDRDVAAAVDRYVQTVTEIRHRMHQHPELSNREFETAKLVADYLRSLGLDEVRTGIAHTGVIGVLRGGKPGPVVAVRADMDALPVTEDTPLPFKSTVRSTYLGQEVGVSHACGHDIHTSVQLGVASVLTSMRKDLPGTVLFIFQPAEEGPPPGEEGGAELMLKDGAFAGPKPSAIFGLHTMASLEVGKVAYTAGPALAASDQFSVVIHGTQAHGASPQLSVDPIVMAAEAILAIQTIHSRNLPPLDPAVVTIGIVRGGQRFNIIPGSVEFGGTVRTYSPAAQDLIERRMRAILQGITAAGGGSVDFVYQRLIPATVNDTALAARMVPTLERVVGADNVLRVDPGMVSEDFAFFAREVPGFYFRLGQVKPGTTSGDHHTPTYLADDSMIPVGMRAMTALVLDYLKGGTGS
jgi:amidohydrolase